jgi:hypothetical protein
MPRLWRPPVSPTFVMPKVGDTVWYYFEHAFWEGDAIASPRLGHRGEVVEFKEWRFAGRTELRSRIARVELVHRYDRGALGVAPEYDTTDRVKCGNRVRLADPRPYARAHVYRRQAAENIIGRIVDGVLPLPGTWGFDPLPPLGGGR